MNDDELRSEFERRSQSADFRATEFAASVSRRIGGPVVARPARFARWAPLAGLAAAASIVLLLVVVLGRSPIGGSKPTGSSPTSSAASSILAEPPSTLSSLPLPQFAEMLSAGSLRGQTVVVHSEVVPAEAAGNLYGNACDEGPLVQPEAPTYKCLVGQLAGTEPPVSVWSPYLADARSVTSATTAPAYVWRGITAPVSGMLVLSVDDHDGVTLLGASNGDEWVFTVGELAARDARAEPFGAAFVVPGWLGGSLLAPPCAPPAEGSVIAELPGRYCDGLSWLTSDSGISEEAQYRVPRGAVQVQGGAYTAFAPAQDPTRTADSRAGVYVVASRLEGSGCPDAHLPCRQWEVIGRITLNGTDGPVGPIATPQPTQGEGSVLSADDFANRFAELRASTVIVDGALVAPPPAGVCSGSALGCAASYATLAGTEVDVRMPYTPTTEDDPYLWATSAPGVWPWWHVPRLESGLLVLRVGDSGIDYLGKVESAKGMSVADAARLDLASQPLEDLVLVDGYLTQRLWGTPMCPAPENYVAELPGRSCNPSSIGDGPGSTTSIGLQDGGYDEFAPNPRANSEGDPEPQFGSYVLARRLEDGNCRSDRSCWVWEVIGRLRSGNDQAPAASPIEHLCSPTISLSDKTGLVHGCTDAGIRDYHSQDPAITLDPTNQRMLRIWWNQSICIRSQQLFVTNRIVAGVPVYSIKVVPIRFDSNCYHAPEGHGAVIEFATPVDPNSVAVQYDSASLPSPGTYTPSPQPTPTAERRYECARPPLPPGETPKPEPLPILIDKTGLVVSCTQTDALVPLAGQISVSNPFEPTGLEVVWVGPCDNNIVFTFRTATSGYDLEGVYAPPTCEPGGGMPIYITFARPMPAQQVHASLTQTVTAGPSLVPCGETVQFTDTTGVVGTCDTAKFLSRDGVLASGNLIVATWTGSSCDNQVAARLGETEVGYHLAISETDGTASPSGDICEGAAVLRTIALHLLTPDVGDVSADVNGQALPNIGAPPSE